MRFLISRYRLCVVLTVVSSALVLAACGTSGNSSRRSRRVTASGPIRYASCMRAHGVSNFPDPSGPSAGPQFSGSGINTQSPAFESAQNACQRLMPGGIANPGSPTQIKQGVKLAECMRSHGLKSFPDPGTSMPSAPAPNTAIVGGPDGFFTLSASIIKSPAFKHAAATCDLPGFRGGAGHSFSMPVAVPGG
jgi:hypothetical protein